MSTIYLSKSNPHKYDVIIEPWLWEKAQQVNRERNKSHTKYNAKPYLLKKLRCAECGCTVSFEGPKSKGQLIYGKCTASSRQHKPSYVNESLLLEQIREKLKSITIPKQVLPEIINGIYKYNKSQKDFFIKRSKELNKEYEELEIELKELFADRKQFKSRPDILESLIQTKVSRQKTIQQELINYEDGNKSYLKASIFLVDVCSRIPELFNSEYRSIEQRRYLLDFVFQNMVLNEKSLVLPLKQPLRILVDKINTSDWCRV